MKDNADIEKAKAEAEAAKAELEALKKAKADKKIGFFKRLFGKK